MTTPHLQLIPEEVLRADLHLSKGTLLRLRQEGLPFLAVGKGVRLYESKEVFSFLKQGYRQALGRPGKMEETYGTIENH